MVLIFWVITEYWSRDRPEGQTSGQLVPLLWSSKRESAEIRLFHVLARIEEFPPWLQFLPRFRLLRCSIRSVWLSLTVILQILQDNDRVAFLDLIWDIPVRPKVILQAVSFGLGSLLLAAPVSLIIFWFIIDSKVRRNEKGQLMWCLSKLISMPLINTAIGRIELWNSGSQEVHVV